MSAMVSETVRYRPLRFGVTRAALRLDRADEQASCLELTACVGFVERVDQHVRDRQVGREGANCKLHEDVPGCV